MPHFEEVLRVTPLPADLRKDSLIGAEVTLPQGMQHLDPDKLSDKDTQTLRDGLFNHGVVVIRNQQGLDPTIMPRLAHVFDATAGVVHSGGDKVVSDKKNILAQNNGSRVPRAPQVTVIGKGKWLGHEGIPELDMKHMSHTTFHEKPLGKDDLEAGFTRPYRWHMDAPLYERLPGFVTSLHSIKNPTLPDQKLRFPSGEVMDIPTGGTAFYSGARAFQLLSDEEKEFALNTTVQYAPRAYEYILNCKATDDGLTIASSGAEKCLDELPAWTWDKVHSFPMVWRNAGNGDPHLQVLGCCVYALHTKDPATGKMTVMSDLDEVRKTCHKLTSKVYQPDTIYVHRWQEGDLVIFHNRGVVHSITGELTTPNTDDDPEKRLFWQCSMISGTQPEAYKSQ